MAEVQYTGADTSEAELLRQFSAFLEDEATLPAVRALLAAKSNRLIVNLNTLRRFDVELTDRYVVCSVSLGTVSPARTPAHAVTAVTQPRLAPLRPHRGCQRPFPRRFCPLPAAPSVPRPCLGCFSLYASWFGWKLCEFCPDAAAMAVFWFRALRRRCFGANSGGGPFPPDSTPFGRYDFSVFAATV